MVAVRAPRYGRIDAQEKSVRVVRMTSLIRLTVILTVLIGLVGGPVRRGLGRGRSPGTPGRPDRRPGRQRDAVLPATRRRGRRSGGEARRERRQGLFAGRDLAEREGSPPGSVGRRVPRPRQRLAEHLPGRPVPADPERIRAEPARRRRRFAPVLRRAADRLADQAGQERRRHLQPPLLCQRQHRARPRRGHPRRGQQRVDNYAAGLLPGRRRGGDRRRLPGAEPTTWQMSSAARARSTRSGRTPRTATTTSCASRACGRKGAIAQMDPDHVELRVPSLDRAQGEA